MNDDPDLKRVKVTQTKIDINEGDLIENEYILDKEQESLTDDEDLLIQL